jgi:hypothetical protein
MAPFPGTQGALNNALANNDYIGGGGLMGGAFWPYVNVLQGQTQGWNNALQGQIQGSDPLQTMNPYLQQYYNAAAQPLTQQYQQATAPNIVGNAAMTGGVGGSGAASAMNQANNSLSQGLGQLAAGIYEPAYAQAQNLSQQAQQQGRSLETGLFGQGQSLQSGLFNQLLGQQQGAINATPSLAQGAYIPANELMQAGQTGQNQLQNILNSAYQNLTGQAQWPYNALSQLASGVSTVGGLGSGSQVQLSPSAGGFK